MTEREAIRLVVLLKGSAKAKQELSRRFRAGDRNGDGALTAAEVPQAAAKLAEIDADGDGRVTWAEAVRAGAGEFVAKAFAQADRNHDGALSGTRSPPTSRRSAWRLTTTATGGSRRRRRRPW